MTYLRNSQGQYGTADWWTSSGDSNDTSCAGQITGTHSFNSNDPFNQKGNKTSTSIASNSSTSITPYSSSMGDNGVNANSQSNGGRTITAIVGATMGAIIFLGLLFILYRHRKRHREGRRGTGFWEGNERSIDSVAALVPFNHPSSGVPVSQISFPSTSLGHSYNGESASSSGNTRVSGEGTNTSNRKAAKGAAQEEGVSAPTPMQRSYSLQVPHSSGVQVRQHTDAMAIIELPPAYRDAAPP